MTNHYLNYAIEPLDSFIFTLSEDSGHRNICLAYPQETKRFSVKDKIINDGLEFEFYTEIHQVVWCFLIVGLI